MSEPTRSAPARGPRALMGLLALLGVLAGPAGAEVPVGGGGPAIEEQAPSIYALDTVMETPEAEEAAGALSADPSVPGPQLAEGVEIGRGAVSWYGGRFHGRRTASGERFDMYALTAAHPTLPFGTRIKVRRLDTGQEIEVRINDRGPHARGRILDLSRGAAQALGVLEAGESNVALVRP